MSAAIKTTNLVKHYGPVTAVDGLTLPQEQGAEHFLATLDGLRAPDLANTRRVLASALGPGGLRAVTPEDRSAFLRALHGARSDEERAGIIILNRVRPPCPAPRPARRPCCSPCRPRCLPQESGFTRRSALRG